jgi:ribosomal protein L23
MALFSKTKETKKEAPVAKAAAADKTVRPALGLAHILKHARITEKASMQQAAGVYVFDVSDRATKRDVIQAVRSLYNVTPRKVAVIRVPKKNVRSMRTGKSGVKTGGKKAYVYLKSGETITIA